VGTDRAFGCKNMGSENFIDRQSKTKQHKSCLGEQFKKLMSEWIEF
jgi:hypothetical protein